MARQKPAAVPAAPQSGDAVSLQPGAQRLVAHLLARFPARRIAVPQLQRDDLGGEALLRLGFQRLPLHQLGMRKEL